MSIGHLCVLVLAAIGAATVIALGLWFGTAFKKPPSNWEGWE